MKEVFTIKNTDGFSDNDCILLNMIFREKAKQISSKYLTQKDIDEIKKTILDEVCFKFHNLR